MTSHPTSMQHHDVEPRRVERKHSKEQEDWQTLLQLQEGSGRGEGDDDVTLKRGYAPAPSQLRWSESRTSCDSTANNSFSLNSSSTSLRVQEMEGSGHGHNMPTTSRGEPYLPRHEEEEELEEEIYSRRYETYENDDRSHQTRRRSGVRPSLRYHMEDDDQSYHTARTGSTTVRHSGRSGYDRPPEEDERSCYTTRTAGRDFGRRRQPHCRYDHEEPRYHEDNWGRFEPRRYHRDAYPADDRSCVSHYDRPSPMDDRSCVSYNGMPRRTAYHGRHHRHDMPRRTYQDHHRSMPIRYEDFNDRPRDDWSDLHRHYRRDVDEDQRRYDDHHHHQQQHARQEYEQHWQQHPPRRHSDDPRRYMPVREEHRRYEEYERPVTRHSAPTLHFPQHLSVSHQNHRRGSHQSQEPLRVSHHSHHQGSQQQHPRQEQPSGPSTNHSSHRSIPPADPVMDAKRILYHERLNRRAQPMPGAYRMPPIVDPAGIMEAKKLTSHAPPTSIPEPPPMVLPTIPSESQSNHNNNINESPSPEDDIFIEIGAGVKSRLRRTKETMEAIANDFYVPATCMGCTNDLFCIADCQYIFCPQCQSISPLKECETNDSKEQVIRREGVGLGFSYDTLFQMQSELVSNAKKSKR